MVGVGSTLSSTAGKLISPPRPASHPYRNKCHTLSWNVRSCCVWSFLHLGPLPLRRQPPLRVQQDELQPQYIRTHDFHKYYERFAALVTHRNLFNLSSMQQDLSKVPSFQDIPGTSPTACLVSLSLKTGPRGSPSFPSIFRWEYLLNILYRLLLLPQA